MWSINLNEFSTDETFQSWKFNALYETHLIQHWLLRVLDMSGLPSAGRLCLLVCGNKFNDRFYKVTWPAWTCELPTGLLLLSFLFYHQVPLAVLNLPFVDYFSHLQHLPRQLQIPDFILFLKGKKGIHQKYPIRLDLLKWNLSNESSPYPVHLSLHLHRLHRRRHHHHLLKQNGSYTGIDLIFQQVTVKANSPFHLKVQ